MNRKKGPIDFPLFIIILVLLSYGLVMVFSSSMVVDYQKFDNAYFDLMKQVKAVGVGLIAMIIMLIIPYQKLRNQRFITIGMLGSIIILIAVLFMPSVKGSSRWIFGVQPSEAVKIMLAIYLADIITRKGEKIKSFTKGVFPVLLVSGIIALLILKEPNMSTAMIILAAAFCMLIVGGAKPGTLFGLVILGGFIGAKLAVAEDYRKERVLSFMDPWKDSLGTGYQAVQSLYALGSGGIFGVGLGQSRQKWHYIPESQNDFIAAIIGEELGLIGIVLLILLFVMLTWRGMKIAMNCKDKFGCLLATGLTSLIIVQATINLLVVSSFMPVTGVTLPLISSGGTSVVFTMASLGILLNISRNKVEGKFSVLSE